MKSTMLLLLLTTLVTLTIADNYCGQHNCYELLGVDRTADEQTIKKAFREMAKKYHPDKNRQEDTTEIFQWINKAYQTLTNDKSRFKYDLHLQNPEQSEYYHEYRYYKQRYIQDPQIPIELVVITLLVLISTLQYVMRKQMYERAIEHITQGQDFKNKVNQKCGSNKKLKQSVKEEMIKDIEIQGGYSLPTYKDVLIYKLVVFPYSLFLWAKKKIQWFIRYTIKKQAYSTQDRLELTLSAMSLTHARWERVSEQQKTDLLRRDLWIKANKKAYEQQMKQKWLVKLKEDNPRQYQLVVKHMKKTQ